MVESGSQPKIVKWLKWTGIFFAVVIGSGLLSNLIDAIDPEGAKRRADEAWQEREDERIAQAAEEQAEIDEAEAEKADEAEDRRNGFHCLSAWDGSNRSANSQIVAALRDPDSFEHAETRIWPLDEKAGEHGAMITYRARNGFGGMNVERIYARINHESCEARLLPGGPGSE